MRAGEFLFGYLAVIAKQDRPRPVRRRNASFPERKEHVYYALAICGLVILGGFIAFHVLAFLASIPIFTCAVIGAVFFSYVIHPIVAWLARRMSVVNALVVVYVTIALIIAFILYIVAPIISHDLQQVARDAPRLVTAGRRLLTDPNDPLTAHLPAALRSFLTTVPTRIETWLQNEGASLARSVMPIVVSFISIVAVFIIIPIAAAYMTAEAVPIKRNVLAILPPAARLKAARIITDLDHVVGGFIRGQILVACIVGSLITLLLLGLHVPYAVLIGVFAGVIDVIPYVGAIAGWLPAFFISYTTNGIGNALAVSVGIIIINQLEGHIIIPNVVSRTVALTPLGVMLALLLAGEVLGLPGLVIAVPAAGVVRVLVVNFANMPRHAPRKPIVPRRIARFPAFLLRLIWHHDWRG
ncbi:MAG: AI-2E family transporter [Candidatus Tyrphobacter sp.]